MASTRDRIVTATIELFRRRGYHGTGLKEVTTAAAATTGSLYHFFPGGKVDLAEAVIVESGAVYRELLESILDEAGDPVEGLATFFDAAADVLVEGDFVDICPIGNVAGEVASTDDRLRAASDAVFTSWERALATRLDAAGLTSADSAEMATIAVATFQGALLLARCRRDDMPLRAAGRHIQQVLLAQVRY